MILKIIDDELSIDDVDAIRHRVSVGDVVHVRGFLERSSDGHAILLHARDITAVAAWKDLHPGAVGTHQRCRLFLDEAALTTTVCCYCVNVMTNRSGVHADADDPHGRAQQLEATVRVCSGGS